MFLTHIGKSLDSPPTRFLTPLSLSWRFTFTNLGSGEGQGDDRGDDARQKSDAES